MVCLQFAAMENFDHIRIQYVQSFSYGFATVQPKTKWNVIAEEQEEEEEEEEEVQNENVHPSNPHERERLPKKFGTPTSTH